MPVDSTIPAHAVPPEPWRSFLQDFDTRLKGAVARRCLGGFVVTQQYGIGRGTSDIDFLSVTAVSAETMLMSLVASARTSTRSIASIFNTSALQLRLATMRIVFNACFPERGGPSCSCSP